MYRQYKILHLRDKAFWPNLLSVTKQVDINYTFDVNPGDVLGWYSFERQSHKQNEVERGTVVDDYGIDLQATQIKFVHPLLTQDLMDGLIKDSFIQPDSTWLISNHRDDRFEVKLNERWAVNNFRTLPDFAYSPEASLIASSNYGLSIFAFDGTNYLCVRTIGTDIYFGPLGTTLTIVAQGANPALSVGFDGTSWLAYERINPDSNNMGIYYKTYANGVWSNEVSVFKEDPVFFPEQQLYDHSAAYTSPQWLVVDDRMWLFYLRTVGGLSTIEYRLEKQGWRFLHRIPTIIGQKKCLRVLKMEQNLVYKGSVVIAWINYDYANAQRTILVPNIYYTFSTPPKSNYDTSGTQASSQGNYVVTKDQFIGTINDEITVHFTDGRTV
jgi:hypothetical protein